MTTATKAPARLLAYDGDCPMCRSTVALLLRLRLVEPEQLKSNHELDPDDLETAMTAGMRNELVVIDRESRETRTGTDGLLWLVRGNGKHRLLVGLLSLPGVRQLLGAGYQVISYNRRVISPPGHAIACDCEPQVTIPRRLSLVLPLVALSAVLWGAFGAAATVVWPQVIPAPGARWGMSASGAVFSVLTLAACVALPADKRLDYVAHLVVTLFVGATLLLPASVLALLWPGRLAMALLACSLAAAAALMFRVQLRRTRALAVSRLWVWLWAIAMLGSFIKSAWLMHLVDG